MGEAWTRFSGHVAGLWSLGDLVLAGIPSSLLIALFMAVLADKPSYDQILSRVSSPRRLYLTLMWAAQDRLDRFFGPPSSWRAFNRCLALAFLYPILALFVAWIFGAVPTLAGIVLFDSGIAVSSRIAILAGLLGLLGAIHAIARRYVALATILRRLLPQSMRRHGFVVGLSELVVLWGAVAGAGAVGGAVAVAAAGAIGVGVAGAIGGAIGGAAAAVILALCVALPVINALYDWASWWISRRLLRHLVGSPPADRDVSPDAPCLRIGAGKLLGHTIFDVAAAGFFLIALAVALPILFQFVNLAFAGFDLPPVEWWLYLAAARRDPLGEGFMVTAMLLTTLLPTAMHFLAMTFALLLPAPTLWGRVGAWLYDRLTKPAPSLLERLAVASWLLGIVLVSWSILVLAGLALEAVIWSWVSPFGTCLADAAQRAGLAVGPDLPPDARAALSPIACGLFVD